MSENAEHGQKKVTQKFKAQEGNVVYRKWMLLGKAYSICSDVLALPCTVLLVDLWDINWCLRVHTPDTL